MQEDTAQGEAPPEPGLAAWPRPTTSPPLILSPIISSFTTPEEGVESSRRAIFCLTMPMAAHIVVDNEHDDENENDSGSEISRLTASVPAAISRIF
jgi:hypothetical protein